MHEQEAQEAGVQTVESMNLGGEHSLRVYEELARAYEKKDANKFVAITIADEKHIRFDRNEGLVKHLLKNLNQKRVSDLSQVYITLSLKDIKAKSELNCTETELEEMVVEMATTGKAIALVNRKEKTVNFETTEFHE